MNVLIKPKSLTHLCEDHITCFKVNNIDYYILCDGSGSYGGGYEALSNTIEELKKSIKELNSYSEKIIIETIYNSIVSIDNKLIKNQIGQTTLIIIFIKNNVIYGFSCGDSKAFILNSKALELTRDQFKERVGSHCIPVYFTHDINNEDTLILGSDGLWNFISIDKIKEILYSEIDIDMVLNNIYKYTVKNSQCDDFSIGLLKL